MAEQQFSWLTESTLDTISVVPQEEKDTRRWQLYKERLLTHKKALIFLAVLLGTLLILKLTQKEEVATVQGPLAMVAVLPIPKGQIIEGMLLRPVRIQNSTLSKTQRLQLLRDEDAEKIMGKVRAKKDIPSQKPIFWTELELIPAAKNITRVPVPVVTYPEN